MEIDVPSLALACAGLTIGALFAVFAGRLCARVFFDASADEPPRHH